MDTDDLVLIDNNLVMSIESTHPKIPTQDSADARASMRSFSSQNFSPSNLKFRDEQVASDEALDSERELKPPSCLAADVLPGARTSAYRGCCQDDVIVGSPSVKLPESMILRKHLQHPPEPLTVLPAFCLPHRIKLDNMTINPRQYEAVSWKCQFLSWGEY